MRFEQENTANPFDDVLRPGETLLWSHVPRPQPVVAHFLRSLMLVAGGLVFMSVCFTLLAWLPAFHQPTHRYHLIGLSWLITYFLLSLFSILPCAATVFLFLYPVLWVKNQRVGHTAYALTNEHLLTLMHGEIVETPLEYVHTIKWYGRDHLWFGDAHPEWKGIKDPKQVVSLIEQARSALNEDEE